MLKKFRINTKTFPTALYNPKVKLKNAFFKILNKSKTENSIWKNIY